MIFPPIRPASGRRSPAAVTRRLLPMSAAFLPACKTMSLTSRGVPTVGAYAWSWDAPFAHTARRYAVQKDPGIIWEGHKAGRHIGYCQIEKLHGLEQLPPHGFQVARFPVKVVLHPGSGRVL